MNETESILYDRLNNKIDGLLVTIKTISDIQEDQLRHLRAYAEFLEALEKSQSVIEQVDEVINKVKKEKERQQRREEYEKWMIRKTQKIFFLMALCFTAYMFISMELWLCRGYRNKNISDS